MMLISIPTVMLIGGLATETTGEIFAELISYGSVTLVIQENH